MENIKVGILCGGFDIRLREENDFVEGFCDTFLTDFDKGWLAKYIYKASSWSRTRLNMGKQLVKKFLFYVNMPECPVL